MELLHRSLDYIEIQWTNRASNQNPYNANRQIPIYRQPCTDTGQLSSGAFHRATIANLFRAETIADSVRFDAIPPEIRTSV